MISEPGQRRPVRLQAPRGCAWVSSVTGSRAGDPRVPLPADLRDRAHARPALIGGHQHPRHSEARPSSAHSPLYSIRPRRAPVRARRNTSRAGRRRSGSAAGASAARRAAASKGAAAPALAPGGAGTTISEQQQPEPAAARARTSSRAAARPRAPIRMLAWIRLRLRHRPERQLGVAVAGRDLGIGMAGAGGPAPVLRPARHGQVVAGHRQVEAQALKPRARMRRHMSGSSPAIRVSSKPSTCSSTSRRIRHRRRSTRPRRSRRASRDRARGCRTRSCGLLSQRLPLTPATSGSSKAGSARATKSGSSSVSPSRNRISGAWPRASRRCGRWPRLAAPG
jgi:hypothetical protein